MESINFELVLRHRQSSRAYQGYLKRINKEHAVRWFLSRAATVAFANGPPQESSSITLITPDSPVAGWVQG
nr:hypothetical protein [Rhizobium etli]